MVTLIEQLVIPKKVANRIDYLLTHEPKTEDECMGEDETICYTKRFDGTPIEMDIKLCGVQFEEGNSNLPWTEAVLWDVAHYGQIGTTEVGDEFFGEWSFEYNGVKFVVNVRKGA